MPLVTLQIIFRRLSSLVWQNESAKSFCDDFVHRQNPKTKKKSWSKAYSKVWPVEQVITYCPLHQLISWQVTWRIQQLINLLTFWCNYSTTGWIHNRTCCDMYSLLLAPTFTMLCKHFLGHKTCWLSHTRAFGSLCFYYNVVAASFMGVFSTDSFSFPWSMRTRTK